jgi:hypothetical protein
MSTFFKSQAKIHGEIDDGTKIPSAYSVFVIDQGLILNIVSFVDEFF